MNIHLSKLTRSHYESGDGRVRLVCAVSALHKESGDVPYFWFGLSPRQLEFLEKSQEPYLCLGCSSSESTLLIPLADLRDYLHQMSFGGNHWHLVVQKKAHSFILGLLGGNDGPDLSRHSISGRA